MSQRELVDAFVDKRITRRRFITGLIATGISVSAAVVYANKLSRAAAGEFKVGDDHYDFYGDHDDHYSDRHLDVELRIFDDVFSPLVLPVPAGAVIHVRNYGIHTHNFTIDGVGVSVMLVPGEIFGITLRGPQTYHVRCTLHGETAQLRVVK